MTPSIHSNDTAESVVMDHPNERGVPAFLSKYGECPTFDCKPQGYEQCPSKRHRGAHFLAIRLKSPGVWDQVSYLWTIECIGVGCPGGNEESQSLLWHDSHSDPKTPYYSGGCRSSNSEACGPNAVVLFFMFDIVPKWSISNKSLTSFLITAVLVVICRKVLVASS